MGAERRVHQYSRSRGFWGTTSPVNEGTTRERKNAKKTYRQRVAACGDTIHIFEVKETLDKHTGEIDIKRVWLGQLDTKASVIDELWDPGNPKRRRRSLLAQSLRDVRRIIETAAREKTKWLQRRVQRFDRHTHRMTPPPPSPPKTYPEDYLWHQGLLEDD